MNSFLWIMLNFGENQQSTERKTNGQPTKMKVLFWIYCRIYWATLHKFELGHHGGVYVLYVYAKFAFVFFSLCFQIHIYIYSYATNYIVKAKKKRQRKVNKTKNTSGNNVQNDANKCQHCEKGAVVPHCYGMRGVWWGKFGKNCCWQ